MDLFFLKKLVSALIMPLSFILLLLIIGLFLYRKKPTLSIKFIATATVLLFAFSFQPVSDTLISPLESQYETFNRSIKPINYIIVLGCGHITDDALPVTTQLYSCSLQRLVEAVRIYNLHPEAKIITSGYAGEDEVSNAEKVKQAAMLLGIPESKIIVESFPQDTEEEAELIAPRVRGTNVVLITNADHMPRSMNYFSAQGVNAIAAPTGHWVKGDGSRYWKDYWPSVYNLEKTTIAWYETLGLTVQWIKQLFN